MVTIPVLKKLEITDAPEVFEMIQSLSSPGVPRWTLAQIQDELTEAESLALFNGTQLCSFVLFKKSLPEQAEISYLASAPLFQKQGLMTKLLREFFLRLSRGSISETEIWLEVHEQNSSARALYEKLNFKQVGARKHYYSDRGDAILYSLKLKP